MGIVGDSIIESSDLFRHSVLVGVRFKIPVRVPIRTRVLGSRVYKHFSSFHGNF